MAFYSYTILDRSGERSIVRVPVEEPSEVELDWETIINANEASFRSALDALTLGTIERHSVTVSEEAIDDTLPTSPYANREAGIRVFYTGVTSGEKRNFTIPAPDLAAVTLLEGTDLVDLTVAPMSTMVAWIEANLFIPYGAADEGVTVTRAVVVGRNN